MRGGGPRRESLDNVQYGLHYAVVTQNQDPDKLERIKVRLPWLDGGDTDQTFWAQLMTPMEGKKFGWYTLPDVDDVVVVMFIAGDINQPVIVGGVWSTPDFSPEPNEDGKNNFRGYRSRSGHRLIFDDSNKPKIVVADKTTKNMIGIGEFDKDGAGPNVCAVYKPPMSGQTGVSISTMEGKLEITCKQGKLLVEAQENVKLNAKTTIDIKAGADMTMDGSSSAKLTSSSKSAYDAPLKRIG
ncbi:MAG TPA: phage baseplate assembly protein V [Kofleriaceae bacterium]|nr:phage baseplate assembly protein V [Kofleriaceae bacterium]